MKNVQTHIAASHGFLAEISKLNPNVMMEVGGILMSGDERPLFAVRSKDGEKPPVDFGDLLTFTYECRETDANTIAEEISKQLFTDGRLANKSLRELCELREKKPLKHFLSRTLLERLPQYICLGDSDIEKICKMFTSVEEFVAAGKDRLRTLGFSVPVEIVKLAQDELSTQMEDSNA